MHLFTKLFTLFMMALLSSCGQNSGQTFRGFEHLKDPVITGESALKAPAPLNAKAQILEYQTAAPNPTDKSYLKIETINQGNQESLRVSANHLVLTPGHAQGVWELINQNEGLESVILEANEIELDGQLKLPIKKLIIRAEKFRAMGQAQIDLRPLDLIEAPQTQDGRTPYQAELIFAVKKLETTHENQIVINASGGRGQKAGAGRPGKPGRSVKTLSGNIVQKCKIVCLMRSRDIPGGGSTFFSGGAQPESVCHDSRWQCKVKDFKWPSNGQNALSPGKPGRGGHAAIVKVSSLKWVKHIKALGGQAGEEAVSVSGGAPGSPNPAVHVKGKKKTVKNFRKGRDAHPPEVDLKSMKGRDGEFLQSSFELNLSQMERVFSLRLEYLKDLYLSGHNDKTLLQMESFAETLKRTPNKSTKIRSIELKATQLLTRLYQGLDYFGTRRASAPMLSLEATGLNFKSEMRRALKFSAFSQWLEAHQASQETMKRELLEQQEILFEEKQLQIKKHAKASQELRALQQLNSQLERQYKLVSSRYEEQKNNINQQAMNNLSAQEHSTLKKALRTAATLASVIPVGQPAAGLVAQSVQALISLQDAQGNFNPQALPRVIDTTIRDYKLEETVSNWNQLVSRYSLNELQGLDSSELRVRLKEMYEMAKPVYQILSQQTQTWSHPKLAHRAFEKEINRLKEVSPGFRELATEVQELSKIRSKYQQKLNQTLEIITESQTKMTQIIQDIALLSPQMAFVNDQLNPLVLESMKQRESLYQEELLSYQAKLARAYQYKNLKAYPHKLNLEKTQKFLMRIMRDKEDASLSDDELEQVEMVYIQQLSSIFKSILDSSAQKGPRREKRVILRLSADEKHALSQNKTVYLDLSSRGLYSENEEEILIEDLNVDQANIRSSKSFDLKVEHEGRGLIEKDGQDFYFNYENRSGRSIFKWGHHFDPTNHHNSGHSQLIDRERNLFLSFMADTVAPQMADDLDIYTRPAGKASLRVEIQANDKVKVNQLELELSYSFYEKN